MRAVFAAAAVVACVISGCSSGDAGSGQTSATPTTSARKVLSTLVDVTLPQGTTISSHSDGVEIWKTSGSQEEAVAALRPQLPLGRDLDGATWCAEHADAKTGSIDWRWAGQRGSVDVNFGTDGSIRIERIAGAATCGP